MIEPTFFYSLYILQIGNIIEFEYFFSKTMYTSQFVFITNRIYHFIFIFPECNSLSNMSITVPMAVAAGNSAKMTCTYDLDSDPLYTVKWYKGRQEFFRYVPKELPHTRVFPWPGINVDVSIFICKENKIISKKN